MVKEEWRDVAGYEGLYQVSNMGRVKSLPKKICRGYLRGEKILKYASDKYGYLIVSLHKNGENKTKYIHRLVAETFVPNDLDKTDIIHINRNITDNNTRNLRWVTRKELCKNKITRAKMAKAKIGVYNTKKSKPVTQYSLEGSFIKDFPSISEIGRELGFACSNIYNCCNGKYKQAYGYIWKFK